MPRKETIKQRKDRVGLLLADYDARNRELGKLNAIVKGLKEQIRELDAGDFTGASLAYGNPREIMDQAEAKRLLTEAGIAIPMTSTQPSIIVTLKP